MLYAVLNNYVCIPHLKMNSTQLCNKLIIISFLSELFL